MSWSIYSDELYIIMMMNTKHGLVFLDTYIYSDHTVVRKQCSYLFVGLHFNLVDRMICVDCIMFLRVFNV